MKLDAGGKPWRRKPSAPPAVSAARTPAPGRSSESAITAIVAAEITQTPAASPSIPSMRLITLIIATMPTIVSSSPSCTSSPTSGSVEQGVADEIDAADERQGERRRP